MKEFNEKNIETAAFVDTSTPESFLRTLGQASQLPNLEATQIATLREQMSKQQIIEYYTLLENFTDQETGKLNIDSAQIIKPKILFHASQNGDIEEFEPRAEKKRSADEPPQVFGAPWEGISAMFLVPANEKFIKSGSYDNGKTWTYIIGDWEKFQANNKGGFIYTLPADTFGVDPNQGLGLFEWTSREPVKPTSKKYFASGLAAMQEFGVKIYVADKATFSRFKDEEEDDIAILKTLKPI